MARKKLCFDSWGIRPDRLRSRIPSCCMTREDDDYIGTKPVNCVARSVARATKLDVINVQSQGEDREGNIYQLTLGRSVPRRFGGGYSVEGSLWVKVPYRR